MKKFIIMSLMLLMAIGVNAQKYAMVDMEYITNNIPEYVRANEVIKKETEKQQQIIDKKTKEVRELYKQYASLESSMTKADRESREAAILAKEKEVSELRQRFFSPEGELEKLREKLITPIQDKIYEAVKKIALRDRYAMVIDRASAQGVIFADPSIDISNEVLRKLGY
ncbi:MAG: OmpH family outer membrane protein [Bacteroides sp.]|nr:OmpH family outer membrane protein [Bacteroides sp.]